MVVGNAFGKRGDQLPASVETSIPAAGDGFQSGDLVEGERQGFHPDDLDVRHLRQAGLGRDQRLVVHLDPAGQQPDL